MLGQVGKMMLGLEGVSVPAGRTEFGPTMEIGPWDECGQWNHAGKIADFVKGVNAPVIHNKIVAFLEREIEFYEKGVERQELIHIYTSCSSIEQQIIYDGQPRGSHPYLDILGPK
eukprot:g33817.t1